MIWLLAGVVVVIVAVAARVIRGVYRHFGDAYFRRTSRDWDRIGSVLLPLVVTATGIGFGGLAAWAWLVYVSTWWTAALWFVAVLTAWLLCGVVAGVWFAWFVRRNLGNVWVQHQGFWIWMAVWRTLLGPIGLGQCVYFFLLRDRLLHAFWDLQDAVRGAR